jgi:hypothetical protein
MSRKKRSLLRVRAMHESHQHSREESFSAMKDGKIVFARQNSSTIRVAKNNFRERIANAGIALCLAISDLGSFAFSRIYN